LKERKKKKERKKERSSAKLKVYGNNMVRRIFGSKRQEVTGGLRNSIKRSFIV
jgi:hypothetical protein